MTAASARAADSTAPVPQDHRWLRNYVVGAVSAAALAYIVAPSSMVVLREIVLYPAVELGAVAAILVGVRLFRPEAPAAWRLIAGGTGFASAAETPTVKRPS